MLSNGKINYACVWTGDKNSPIHGPNGWFTKWAQNVATAQKLGQELVCVINNFDPRPDCMGQGQTTEVVYMRKEKITFKTITFKDFMKLITSRGPVGKVLAEQILGGCNIL